MSLLALFALAVQLGLSFGHVHAASFSPLNDKAALADTLSADTPSPDTHHDQDNGNDVCAICATIAMANTLVDAAPPVLPLPAKLHAEPHFVTAVFATAQPQRLSFQSRAPPRS
ncbi:MAG: DUF2946 domain-containing protein [Burkholderiaceae bacterium]|nr:DUF2946 domain-containing protein [Burkholderiaceae bacterium]